jgi:RNA polymerase sigma factor for flagellar operon FliA
MAMKGLVKRYKQDTAGVDGKLRDQLIMDYSPLIRFVAQRIIARLPANIDIDDLTSAGVIGLMDAIEKYDPSRDNKFKTYAEFRIRGSMLDELRNQDWIPRSVRDKAKKIDRASLALEQELGRAPTEIEVANRLEIDLNTYQSMVAKVKSTSLVSVDDSYGQYYNDRKTLLESLEHPTSINPLHQIKSKSMKEMMLQNINELPERQKLVLSLYYYEELNLREIGKILAVTESRVSQLHSQALERLKSKLKKKMPDYEYE